MKVSVTAIKEFVVKYRWLLTGAAALAACGLAFTAGRISGPVKTIETVKTVTVEKVVTKTEVQVVEKVVEKKVYVKAVARDVHTETVTTKAPDGTVTTKVTTDDKTKVGVTNTDIAKTDINASASATTTDDKVVKTEMTKITESYIPQWHLGLRAGGGLTLPRSPTLVVGVTAERRILGPVFAGLWADLHLNVIPGVTPQGFAGGISVAAEF